MPSPVDAVLDYGDGLVGLPPGPPGSTTVSSGLVGDTIGALEDSVGAAALEDSVCLVDSVGLVDWEGSVGFVP